jgi:hypothetical protein
MFYFGPSMHQDIDYGLTTVIGVGIYMALSLRFSMASIMADASGVERTIGLQSSCRL